MKPISHPSNTRTLNAPGGWDQSGLPVDPLAITDQVFEGVPCVWSFWKPDAEELAAINAGMPVILSLVGRTMAPALLMVEARQAERGEGEADCTEKYIAMAERCSAEVGRYEGRAVWVKFHTQSSFEAFVAGIAMFSATRPTDEPQADAGVSREPLTADVWRTAMTLANNLCVQISDRYNGDDATVEADAAAECARQIRAYLDPGEEAVSEMLKEREGQ